MSANFCRRNSAQDSRGGRTRAQRHGSVGPDVPS